MYSIIIRMLHCNEFVYNLGILSVEFDQHVFLILFKFTSYALNIDLCYHNAIINFKTLVKR